MSCCGVVSPIDASDLQSMGVVTEEVQCFLGRGTAGVEAATGFLSGRGGGPVLGELRSSNGVLTSFLPAGFKSLVFGVTYFVASEVSPSEFFPEILEEEMT